jgi:hypothetical protein
MVYEELVMEDESGAGDQDLEGDEALQVHDGVAMARSRRAGAGMASPAPISLSPASSPLSLAGEDAPRTKTACLPHPCISLILCLSLMCMFHSQSQIDDAEAGAHEDSISTSIFLGSMGSGSRV